MSIQSQSHESIESNIQSSDSSDQDSVEYIITRDRIKQVAQDLGIIILCWPEITNPEFEGRTHFPKSYFNNSSKEKLALFYAENFRKQFVFHYPNRRPIILAAPNECGLQKLVCTTITPTCISDPELGNWQSCAQFVADHITYEPLARQIFFPERILCPHTVFKRHLGNSFEMATALCSLLIGLGYDAYVAAGYATQDITECIRVRTECPIKPEEHKKEVVQEDKTKKKYELKPIRDLRSKFLLELEQRKIEEAERLKQEELERQRKEQEELEKAPADDMFGWRVHSWVLLLPKIDVAEPVFVEASTGVSYPISTDVYTSLDSIWNIENYWVNMQDCSNGLGNLSFELTDISCWEHLLVGEPIHQRKAFLDPEYEGDENSALDEKHLDMPGPWGEPIDLPHSVIARRYPGGVKSTCYKRTILTQYGEYVQLNGLSDRIMYYNDMDYLDLTVVEELYANRLDCLTRTHTEVLTGSVTEYFKRGRADACKVHTYNMDNNKIESARLLEFYNECRRDGLTKLELDPLFTKEYFINRADRLNFRHATFAPRGYPPPGMVEGIRRIVTNITEKFDRDESKNAHDDIAVREFALVENEIHLKYHYAKGHVTRSTRDFIKPNVTELGDSLTFNPDLTAGYHADINAEPPKKLQLFYLLQAQLLAEDKSLRHLRDIEDEIKEYLRARAIECAAPQLYVSIWNREQNQEYREAMQEKEQQEREIKEREIEEEIDYLAPYIMRLGNVTELNKNQAQLVRDQCLKEFRELMVFRANRLKDRFEKLYSEHQKVQWSDAEQMSSLDVIEDEKRLNSLAKQKYELQILNFRITRHREMSAQRYSYLERYLRLDSRLAALYDEEQDESTE